MAVIKSKTRKHGGGGRDIKTPQEKEVQQALSIFWYEHYTKLYTTEQRNKLAEEFAQEWLDPTKFKIDKAFIRHPATRHRLRDRIYTVGEVLADFIMRADQVAERSEEFPVSNQDHNVTGTARRREVERSIFFRYDKFQASEEDKPLPPYSVREETFIQANSVEDVIFAEVTPDVSKFRAQLRKVKRFAEFYATTYSEEYGYEKEEALRRIKRLDLSRVRECEICGGAFYAHDFRRRVCDTQCGIKVHKVKSEPAIYEVSKESACELERDRKSASERYKTGRLVEENSII